MINKMLAAIDQDDVEQPQFFHGAVSSSASFQIASLPYSSGVQANTAQNFVLWVQAGDVSSVRLAPGQQFADGVTNGDSVAASSTFNTPDNSAISFLSVTDAYAFVGTDAGCLTVYRTAEDLGGASLSLSKPFRTESFGGVGGAIVAAFANEHGTCCVIQANGAAFLLELGSGGSAGPAEMIADPSKQIKCGAFVAGRPQHEFELVLGSTLRHAVFAYTGAGKTLHQATVENQTEESMEDGSGWMLAGLSAFHAPVSMLNAGVVDATARASDLLFLFFICVDEDASCTSYQCVGRLQQAGNALLVQAATCNEVYVESAAEPHCCYFTQIPGWETLLVSHSSAQDVQLFQWKKADGEEKAIVLRPPEGRNLGAPDTDSSVKGFALLANYTGSQPRGAAQEPLQNPPLFLLLDSSQHVSLHFGDHHESIPKTAVLSAPAGGAAAPVSASAPAMSPIEQTPLAPSSPIFNTPKPPPKQMPQTFASMAALVEFKMTEIYEKHNPDKLEKIPGLLQKYAADPEKIYHKLCDTYKVPAEDLKTILAERGPTPAGGAAGGSGSGNATSLFGGAAPAAPAGTKGGLFGSVQASMGGGATPSPFSVGGAGGGGGLFGGPSPAPPSGGGLFGDSASAAAGGLFAKPAESAQSGGGVLFGGGAAKPAEPTNSTSSSLFGGSTNPAEAPARGGLFGATPADIPAGGLFGAPSGAAPASGGLFGAAKDKEPAEQEQAGSAGGLFGSSKPAEPAPASGLFGANRSAADSAPAPAGGLFGATTTAPTDGATTSSPSSGGLFGFGGAKPADGPAAGGLFGGVKPADSDPTPGGGLFGGHKPADPVAPLGGGLFGSKPQDPSAAGTSGLLFGGAKPAPAPAVASSVPVPAGSSSSASSSEAEQNKEQQLQRAAGGLPAPAAGLNALSLFNKSSSLLDESQASGSNDSFPHGMNPTKLFDSFSIDTPNEKVKVNDSLVIEKDPTSVDASDRALTNALAGASLERTSSGSSLRKSSKDLAPPQLPGGGGTSTTAAKAMPPPKGLLKAPLFADGLTAKADSPAGQGTTSSTGFSANATATTLGGSFGFAQESRGGPQAQGHQQNKEQHQEQPLSPQKPRPRRTSQDLSEVNPILQRVLTEFDSKLCELEEISANHQADIDATQSWLPDLEGECSEVTGKMKLVALDVVASEHDDLERARLEHDCDELKTRSVEISEAVLRNKLHTLDASILFGGWGSESTTRFGMPLSPSASKSSTGSGAVGGPHQPLSLSPALSPRTRAASASKRGDFANAAASAALEMQREGEHIGVLYQRFSALQKSVRELERKIEEMPAHLRQQYGVGLVEDEGALLMNDGVFGFGGASTNANYRRGGTKNRQGGVSSMRGTPMRPRLYQSERSKDSVASGSVANPRVLQQNWMGSSPHETATSVADSPTSSTGGGAGAGGGLLGRGGHQLQHQQMPTTTYAHRPPRGVPLLSSALRNTERTLAPSFFCDYAPDVESLLAEIAEEQAGDAPVGGIGTGTPSGTNQKNFRPPLHENPLRRRKNHRRLNSAAGAGINGTASTGFDGSTTRMNGLAAAPAAAPGGAASATNGSKSSTAFLGETTYDQVQAARQAGVIVDHAELLNCLKSVQNTALSGSGLLASQTVGAAVERIPAPVPKFVATDPYKRELEAELATLVKQEEDLGTKIHNQLEAYIQCVGTHTRVQKVDKSGGTVSTLLAALGLHEHGPAPSPEGAGLSVGTTQGTAKDGQQLSTSKTSKHMGQPGLFGAKQTSSSPERPESAGHFGGNKVTPKSSASGPPSSSLFPALPKTFSDASIFGDQTKHSASSSDGDKDSVSSYNTHVSMLEASNKKTITSLEGVVGALNKQVAASGSGGGAGSGSSPGGANGVSGGSKNIANASQISQALKGLVPGGAGTPTFGSRRHSRDSDQVGASTSQDSDKILASLGVVGAASESSTRGAPAASSKMAPPSLVPPGKMSAHKKMAPPAVGPKSAAGVGTTAAAGPARATDSAAPSSSTASKPPTPDKVDNGAPKSSAGGAGIVSFGKQKKPTIGRIPTFGGFSDESPFGSSSGTSGLQGGVAAATPAFGLPGSAGIFNADGESSTDKKPASGGSFLAGSPLTKEDSAKTALTTSFNLTAAGAMLTKAAEAAGEGKKTPDAASAGDTPKAGASEQGTIGGGALFGGAGAKPAEAENKKPEGGGLFGSATASGAGGLFGSTVASSSSASATSSGGLFGAPAPAATPAEKKNDSTSTTTSAVASTTTPTKQPASSSAASPIFNTPPPAGPSGTQEVQKFNSLGELVESKMREIYQKQNPEKLAKIPDLMKKYAANPMQIYNKLCDTYSLPKEDLQAQFNASQQQGSAGAGGGLFDGSTAAPAPAGATGANAAAPASGGLFGASTSAGPATAAPAPASGGLFGTPAPAASSTTPPVAPAASGGLFGQPAAAPTTGAGGLFGNAGSTTTAAAAATPPAAPAVSGGLFGTPAPSATTSGAGGGLFGTPAAGAGASTASAQPQQAGGLFGTPAPAAAPQQGGLFGQPQSAAPQQQASGGLFGTPAPAQQPQMGATAHGGQPSYEDQVRMIYQKYNQAKMGEIPSILQKYAGQLPTLIAKLVKKYNVQQADLMPQQQQQGGVGAPFGQPQQPQGAQPSPFANNTNQAGGALFGSTNQQPAQQSGGLFGNSQPQQQQGSGLFGSQQPAQQQSGGLFGSSQQPAPAQQGGLFGAGTQQPQQQSGGLFGNNMNQQPQQQGGGLFGNNTQQQPQQQQGGGLFGSGNQQQLPQQQGGLFGNNTQQQPQQQGGLFGSQQPQQQQSGGLFGANTAPQLQSQSGGPFGNNSAPQPQQQSGLFGNSNPQQPQQQQGGLFGSTGQQPQQQQQSSGLFGSGGGAASGTSPFAMGASSFGGGAPTNFSGPSFSGFR